MIMLAIPSPDIDPSLREGTGSVSPAPEHITNICTFTLIPVLNETYSCVLVCTVSCPNPILGGGCGGKPGCTNCIYTGRGNRHSLSKPLNNEFFF